MEGYTAKDDSNPTGNGCNWTIKADDEPACDRLVLNGGWKLVFAKLDSPQEAARRKQKEFIQKAETAKTKRRDDFMQAQQQNQVHGRHISMQKVKVNPKLIGRSRRPRKKVIPVMTLQPSRRKLVH